MTEEEKQQVENGKLLVSDLCARLPYKVKLQKVGEPDTVYELYSMNVETLEICFWKYKGKSLSIADSDKLYRLGIQRYKPYLRPMSSMTEEEKKEFDDVLKSCNRKVFACPDKERRYRFFDAEQVDFMNKHHFDYRGLIERGLALEAPESMYIN